MNAIVMKTIFIKLSEVKLNLKQFNIAFFIFYFCFNLLVVKYYCCRFRLLSLCPLLLSEWLDFNIFIFTKQVFAFTNTYISLVQEALPNSWARYPNFWGNSPNFRGNSPKLRGRD